MAKNGCEISRSYKLKGDVYHAGNSNRRCYYGGNHSCGRILDHGGRLLQIRIVLNRVVFGISFVC